MIDVPVKPLRIRSGWQQHHDRGTFCNAGSRFFDPFPDLPSIRRIAPYNTGPNLRQSVLLWGVVPFTLRIPRQSACVQGKTKLCIELVKNACGVSQRSVVLVNIPFVILNLFPPASPIPRRKLRSAIRTRLFFSFDLSALRKYLMNQPLYFLPRL